MAEAVLGIVLENLNSLIQKELGLLSGFDQNMKRLSSLFTAIKATLEDAAEKQFSDKAIKDWLQKLKDTAHILDDILDDCAYETLKLEYQGVGCGLSNKVQRSLLSSFHPKHVVSRYKIAKKMEKISERLDEIAKEREQLHLIETVPERRNEVVEWRQTTSFVTEPQVYGREKDKGKIVDFLVGDASHFEDLSVYPVVGLGGLGKTTLAQLIFNNERVVIHFELRIWVCVSEDFSLKRMMKIIIEAASGCACPDLDLEPLQRKLHNLLQRKKYLLVLDDVWDDEQDKWQRLKSVLACGAKGASILVTTRLSTVASIMGTIPPHELSLLSKNDCWQLFKHRAFGPNEVQQAELVVIGKEIVHKCGGVPLAAKALGGLLRFKREKKEWLYVKESNLWSLPHNENHIIPALRLSYLHLPLRLRQCFAFCAIFPKDERIWKQDLIEFWIANGFISSNEILDAEDVGEGVWNELYWRSFFQDVETDEFGKVRSFKMHDLVHDLAQFVAEDVCCITNDNDVTTLSERIHHLSNHRKPCRLYEEANSIKLHQVKSLRTYRECCNTSQLSAHVLKCYSLRVLCCKPRKELSSSIGDLKHLRYLNLSRGDFVTLPQSLCNLWNLQILKLDDCGCLQKLPNNLVNLKALQRLYLNGCRSLSSLPPRIGKLTSLRNISLYIVGKEKGSHLAELGGIKLKGDLHIKHLEKVKCLKDAKDANMSSKQLNKLWLSWDNNEEWESQGNVGEILEALQPDTQQLESLTITGYKGVHFPQWMFSHSLKRWEISGCGEVQGLHGNLQRMIALQTLKLHDLPKLESLPDCFGNLPLLYNLTIRNCPKLSCLPTSISLSNIKRLSIWGCPELATRCEVETGEDWPKIAHISYIEAIPTTLTEFYDSCAELFALGTGLF